MCDPQLTGPSAVSHEGTVPGFSNARQFRQSVLPRGTKMFYGVMFSFLLPPIANFFCGGPNLFLEHDGRELVTPRGRITCRTGLLNLARDRPGPRALQLTNAPSNS